jgi:hypothetical protein
LKLFKKYVINPALNNRQNKIMSKSYYIFGYQFKKGFKEYLTLNNLNHAPKMKRIYEEETKYLNYGVFYTVDSNDENEGYIIVNKSPEKVLCNISEFILDRTSDMEMNKYDDLVLITGGIMSGECD